MKIQRLLSHILVPLCTCIITDACLAEIVEHLPSNTAIKPAADGAECAECPPCPSVTSCPAGYSCQPNDHLLPGGEQQLYPPSPGNAWVQSEVDVNTLADVPIDDPRWNNRSESEVYARENSDAIVWYWPDSGDAVFDTTSLGDQYTWNSYIYSTGEQLSGGPSSTAENHAVHFRKGRGISIFKRVDDSTPPPSDDDFLAIYSNPEQAKTPADGMYPFGQRMWLSGYSDKSSELKRMKNAGFTMSGPHYHGCSPTDYHPNMERISNYGMKAYWRLYTGSGGWRTVLTRMETSNGRAELREKIKRCINAVLDNPLFNSTVVAWYGSPDEPIDRPSTPVGKLRGYMEFARNIIVELDPKKRPLFWSERGDSSANNMKANAKYTAGIMKQNYLMKANNYDYDGKEMDERFLIGQWVRDQLNADAVNALPYTGKRRPIITTLSMYVDPDNPSLRNENWLRKAITHDVYLSIAMGVHGINLYTWHTSGGPSQKTKSTQENLYMEVIGRFSQAGLPEVFLWGEERDDIQMEIIDGQETFQWQRYGMSHTEPSIQFRNIQYGANRYILLVNSSKEIVRLKLSGFPVDRQPMRILDMIPEKWRQLNATLISTIPPLGVQMYKITRN